MTPTRPGRPLSGRGHRGAAGREQPPTETAQLEIASIAAGGDGVGRSEGLVVFVPRTAPGDTVTVKLRRKGRFARGELVQVDVPSPSRVEPSCEHYTRDRCGGCQLQHVAYGAQLDVKAGIVRDALSRIGGQAVDVASVAASPLEWRYRRKLTLALRKKGGRWIAGLHPYDRPDHLFSLRDCPITDERVVAIWRDVLAVAELLPEVPALRGAVQIRDDLATFSLEGALLWPTHAEFFESVSSIAELWWTPEFGVRHRLGERGAEAGAGASFLQVNAEVAESVWAHAVERALAHNPASVVDAYAGTGEIGVRLAAEAERLGGERRITAIESDPDAAREAERRLPVGSRVITGLVEHQLASALPSDVVILNPPRGGLEESVTTLLRDMMPRPAALIYVSCDPATLARDVRRLGVYRSASARAFDMFPQTAHVETVCELVPETP